ncbi:hypothetical protein EMCRGX_G013646 [Ephydatia muelleri]
MNPIRISAQEGDNITILCTATDTILLEIGNPTRNSPPRKLSPSNVTCFTDSTCIYSFALLNVTRNDAGVYICLNTSEAYYVTVTAPIPSSCSPRNESLGQCYHYIQQGSIYFNKSSPHTPDAVDLYFHRLDTQSPPMCAEKLKRLLCWSIYPLCGPKGQLPLCKESCDVAAEGPCALNSTMRSLLLSNCGGPMPLAGDLPECLQLPSDTSPNTHCTSQEMTTISGRYCQFWETQYPHFHGSITPALYPGELNGSARFCRNPGGRGARGWCYTTDPDVRWEYCAPIHDNCDGNANTTTIPTTGTLVSLYECMCMCACKCVCGCVCMCVGACVAMCMCVHLWVCACVGMCMCAGVCMCVCGCECACVCVYMHVWVCGGWVSEHTCVQGFRSPQSYKCFNFFL